MRRLLLILLSLAGSSTLSAQSIDTGFDETPAATTHSPAASFEFNSTVAGATFQYSLDGGTWISATNKLVLGFLGLGQHTLSVRAIDGMTIDPTPAMWTWTIERAVSANDATVYENGVLFPILGKDPLPDSGQSLNTFYVDRDNGSAGNGSLSNPWNDFQDAVDFLHAGDRLYILPSTSPYQKITIGLNSSDGTAAAPIWVIGTAGALIKSSAGNAETMIQVQRSYWNFQGLEIDAQQVTSVQAFEISAPGGGTSVSNINIDSCYFYDLGPTVPGHDADDAIVLETGSSNIRISNCTMSGFFKGLMTDLYDCHGVLVRRGCSDVEILGNHMFDNSGDGVQIAGINGTGAVPKDIEISGNKFHDQRENGVDIKSSDGVTVSDNLMYNIHGTPGYGDPGCAIKVHAEAESVVIERNHIHSSGKAGIDVGVGNGDGNGTKNLTITRNYIVGNGFDDDYLPTWGIHVSMQAVAPNGTKAYEISHNILTGWPTGIHLGIKPWQFNTLWVMNNAMFDFPNTSASTGLLISSDPSSIPTIQLDGNAFVGGGTLQQYVSIGGLSNLASWWPANSSVTGWQSGLVTATMNNNELSDWNLPADIISGLQDFVWVDPSLGYMSSPPQWK